MPRRKATDLEPEAAQVECAASECSARFTPRRKDQRYCSSTCRQRGARARRHAERAAEIDAAAEADAGGAEHELVKATRRELGESGLATVNGQLALQLARRMADPQVSGFSALSKELRSLLAEAKSGAPTSPDGDAAAAGAEPDDEVTRARRAREEAREAAGRS